MNTQTPERLVRFGKVLNVIGIIFACLCIMAGLFFLVAAIVVLLLPEGALNSFLDSIQLGSALSVLQPGTVLSDILPPTLIAGIKYTTAAALLGGLLYAVASAAILFILSSVFRSTAVKGSPFLPENVKRLKIVGVILIVASVCLGLGNLIFAFCVLALAFIFQYGMELQQQADETL